MILILLSTSVSPFSVRISTSKLPIQWCSHHITPIHKSGDKSLISNYPPISLLCVLSEVLEKVIYHRIIIYLENSFTPQQFGFLLRRSAMLNSEHKSYKLIKLLRYNNNVQPSNI